MNEEIKKIILEILKTEDPPSDILYHSRISGRTYILTEDPFNTGCGKWGFLNIQTRESLANGFYPSKEAAIKRCLSRGYHLTTQNLKLTLENYKEFL